MSLSLFSRIFLSALGTVGRSVSGVWPGAGGILGGGIVGGFCSRVGRGISPAQALTTARPVKKLRRVPMGPPPPGFPGRGAPCPPQMLYSPPEKTMSSFLSEIPWFSVSNLLHILGIAVVAILVNRILRVITQSLVKPAASQARSAQARE